jgi:hypothetical protein
MSAFVVAVWDVPDVPVANGTTLEDAVAACPTTVAVTLSDTTAPSIDVTWAQGYPVYNGIIKGAYSFIGTLGTLPEGVTNPTGVIASVLVVVARAPIPAQDASYQNARVYWEMYGGVPPEGNDQRVQAFNLDMDVGGWAADDHAYSVVDIWGRATIDSPNLAILYTMAIYRPTGSIMWQPLHIRVSNTDPDVRCVVVKVTLIEATFTAPDGSTQLMTYADQYLDADAPPWGIRIHEASLFCSDLVRDVRVQRIFEDILAGCGFTYSGPDVTWMPDQINFSDIPKDRWDALDDVNGMLGWNYACWDGTQVEFALPKSGTAHAISASDPRTTWSVEESLDETYNAVRVCYGNKAGKPREVVVHGSTAALHGTVRTDTLQAPESIKSGKAARRFGRRYLASHETKQVAGSVSITGDDGVIDPLLIRPGGTVKMTGPARTLSGTHEITHVTLRPLEWTADVEFGTNSKRFDTWLARLAAGAKSIKRR